MFTKSITFTALLAMTDLATARKNGDCTKEFASASLTTFNGNRDIGLIAAIQKSPKREPLAYMYIEGQDSQGNFVGLEPGMVYNLLLSQSPTCTIPDASSGQTEQFLEQFTLDATGSYFGWRDKWNEDAPGSSKVNILLDYYSWSTGDDSAIMHWVCLEENSTRNRVARGELIETNRAAFRDNQDRVNQKNQAMSRKTFALALTAVAAQAENPHDDKKIAALVEGFFIGAFDFQGMTDIAHCISDANPVEKHFENAMGGFWNGSYQEVTKAIDQLGLSVSDIGDMLDHCEKIDHHDYEQIQRMAEAFLHPKQLLLEATESVIVNGVNIFEDVREGLHDDRMGHFLDAGEHFGQAAAMLLYGKTQMVDHEELFFDFDTIDQEKEENQD